MYIFEHDKKIEICEYLLFYTYNMTIFFIRYKYMIKKKRGMKTKREELSKKKQ